MSAPTPASTALVSFSCPHCGALAHQNWFDVLAFALGKDNIPIQYRDDLKEWLYGPNAPKDMTKEEKHDLLKATQRISSGEIFFYEQHNPYNPPIVQNVHLSKCYSCDGIAVWINHELVHPKINFEIPPTEDMPDVVRRDYDEAASIASASPRAATALLRLCIEKLCNEINGSTDTIFDGIGKLAQRGLDTKIQKALDIVRVTGNTAIHPGQIDKSDTTADARNLFRLVNVIVENLITLPKEIDELYETIPESKRDAIDRRDGKTPKS